MCIDSTLKTGGSSAALSLGHDVGKYLSINPKFTGLVAYGLRDGGISFRGAILESSEPRCGVHGFARYSFHWDFDCAMAPMRRAFPGAKEERGFHAMSRGTVTIQETKCFLESRDGGRRSVSEMLRNDYRQP